MAVAALGLGLLGSALLITTAELTQRYRARGSFRLTTAQDEWVRDPDLLYRLNPRNPSYPLSYRGKAPRSTPGADVCVVCMGGSTTFGNDVEVDESSVWSMDAFHDIFTSDLRNLVSEIQANGSAAVLVIFTSLFHEEMTPEEIALFEPLIWEQKDYHPEMLTELDRKRSTIRAVAREFDVPLVDAQEMIEGFTGQDRIALFHDNMHPSAEGNRRIGELVGRCLAELIRGTSPDSTTTPTSEGVVAHH